MLPFPPGNGVFSSFSFLVLGTGIASDVRRAPLAVKSSPSGASCVYLPLLRTCLLLIFGSVLFSANSTAQSSLFNIPTADTLSKGERYVEIDFDAHFGKYRDGGWQSYGGMGIYGLNNRTEIGLNAYATRFAGGFGSIEIQPNFKFKAYQNERLGLTVSGGAIGYIPLKGGRLRDSQVSAYAVATKSFSSDWAPRLTGGAYELLGRDRGEARRGLMFGVEQPIHERITLIGDWNTAKNRFGYAAAGVGVTLTKRSYLYSAYYFGNEGRANNSFGIYYGYSF